MKTCSEWAVLCWIEAHPGLASWLQAIGTLVALVTAFAAPYWIEHVRETRERRRHRSIAEHLINVAVSHAQAFADGLGMPALLATLEKTFDFDAFQGAIDALDKIDWQKVDCASALTEIGRLKLRLANNLIIARRVGEFAVDKRGGAYRDMMIQLARENDELATAVLVKLHST